jgi:L-fucose mutarotase
MQPVPGETYQPEIWDTYRDICKKQEFFTDFESVERFAFYERAKKAYAVIATSETALYANIILKKGVVI